MDVVVKNEMAEGEEIRQEFKVRKSRYHGCDVTQSVSITADERRDMGLICWSLRK